MQARECDAVRQIEPYAVRFAIGTKVIGPKPATVIPAPKLSMSQDAERIARRSNKHWGFRIPSTGMGEANQRRSDEAKERRAELCRKILALIAEHPRAKGDLAEKLGVSHQAIRDAFKALDGQVVSFKGAGGLHYWRPV